MKSYFVALLIAAVPAGALQAPLSFHDQQSQKCQVGSVWWVHVVKNGASFQHAIRDSGCAFVTLPSYPHGGQVKPVNGGVSHMPLPDNVTDEDLGHVVGIFRKADQRLASSFGHLSRHMVTSKNGWFGWGFATDEEARRVHELAARGKTPGNEDSLRKYVGCQTNMIMGRGCMTGVVNDPADIKAANARIDKFLMVGIQEEWELSICLFNYKVTGKRFINEVQIQHGHNRGASVHGNATEYDTSDYPRIDPDKELYEHIRAKFMNDIKKYNINRETCGHQESGQPYVFGYYIASQRG